MPLSLSLSLSQQQQPPLPVPEKLKNQGHLCGYLLPCRWPKNYKIKWTIICKWDVFLLRSFSNNYWSNQCCGHTNVKSALITYSSNKFSFLKLLDFVILTTSFTSHLLNEICRLNGMVDCGARHEHIYKRTMLLAEQVRVSKGSPIITCLLEGPSGRSVPLFLVFIS